MLRERELLLLIELDDLTIVLVRPPRIVPEAQMSAHEAQNKQLMYLKQPIESPMSASLSGRVRSMQKGWQAVPSKAVGLAVVERLEVGELLLVALHEGGELEHEPGALGRRDMLAPGRVERLARGFDGEIDILGRC